MLIIFDVTSLFTNIPIDELVHIICGRLLQDKKLVDRTFLSPDRYLYLSVIGTYMNMHTVAKKRKS